MDKIIKLLPWDSELFKRNILEISELIECKADVFNKLELKYSEDYDPFMVFVKVNGEDISKIHFLEQMGFRYIETQFHIQKRLTHKYDLNVPIKIDLAREIDLVEILKIAKTTFDTDRYYIDPDFDKNISGSRYFNWINNNWYKENYFLYKFELYSNIVGFAFVQQQDKIVYYLLGGVSQENKGLGIGLQMNLCLSNYLKDD